MSYQFPTSGNKVHVYIGLYYFEGYIEPGCTKNYAAIRLPPVLLNNGDKGLKSLQKQWTAYHQKNDNSYFLEARIKTTVDDDDVIHHLDIRNMQFDIYGNLIIFGDIQMQYDKEPEPEDETDFSSCTWRKLDLD